MKKWTRIPKFWVLPLNKADRDNETMSMEVVLMAMKGKESSCRRV